MTLGWKIVGVVVLAVSAMRTSSVALAGFGLDSLIEIGASIVVLWELSGTEEDRQRRALRLIGGAFGALAIYLLAQSSIALLNAHRATHSTLVMVWAATTAVVMFAPAAGKTRTGSSFMMCDSQPRNTIRRPMFGNLYAQLHSLTTSSPLPIRWSIFQVGS